MSTSTDKGLIDIGTTDEALDRPLAFKTVEAAIAPHQIRVAALQENRSKHFPGQNSFICQTNLH